MNKIETIIQGSFTIDGDNNFRPLGRGGKPTCLMMLRIVDKAASLSPVIDPEPNRKNWDEAWEKYVADMNSGRFGVTRGNVTIIGVDPKHIGEAFAHYDQFSQIKSR